MVKNPLGRELNIPEFVEAYIRRIAQLPGCDKVAFDPVTMAIRFECQGQVCFARPQNAYAEYRKDISRLDAVLDAHISMIQFNRTELPRAFAAVAPSLMPMVRDRRYLDLALLEGRISGTRVLELSELAGFPFREIAGELVLTLVRDSANATSLVNEEQLKEWGVSFDQACDVAMKNLRGRTQLRMEELAPGLYGSKWQDTYDATRMLLTELLQSLPRNGDLVVAAPTRTHLLVAGSQDLPALAALTRVAAQLLTTDPKPLSADLLQFSGGRWIEAEAWLRHDTELANARCNLLYGSYAHQKELLERLHQANGTELFVASYLLAKDEGKREPLVNVAQLTEGVVTLLPKADYMMLMTRSQETMIVTWADAAAVMGGALRKLKMHPPRYLADTFPNAQQLAALRAKVVKFDRARKEPAESGASREAEVAIEELMPKLLSNAEAARFIAREEHNVEIGYDLEGVRWLDGYARQLQKLDDAEISQQRLWLLGSLLGECIVRNIGGRWCRHQGFTCVKLNSGNYVFPFNKLKKQLESEPEAGHSALGFYESILAMEPRALSETQKRLAALYKERGDCRIFVPSTGGSSPEWAQILAIEHDAGGIKGDWLRLGRLSWSGSGEISTSLAQVTSFYAVDSHGKLVLSEGISASDAALLPEDLRQAIALRAAAAASKPHQVATAAHDSKMQQLLFALRQRFSSIQRNPAPRAFERKCAPNPPWMKDSDGLSEIGRQQMRLLAEGKIVWAALVQANELMFKPGFDDCPGLLVYSHDHHFDSRPDELLAIAHKIFELKKTTPADPELREVARLVTDEMDRSMGWKVPETLTDKDVYTAAFMVFRKHIPKGVLTASQFPILIHASTQAVMIVPVETWPTELIRAWQQHSGTL